MSPKRISVAANDIDDSFADLERDLVVTESSILLRIRSSVAKRNRSVIHSPYCQMPDKVQPMRTINGPAGRFLGGPNVKSYRSLTILEGWGHGADPPGVFLQLLGQFVNIHMLPALQQGLGPGVGVIGGIEDILKVAGQKIA